MLSTAQVAVINAALDVVDHSMQVHGGAGVSQEFPLAGAWAGVSSPYRIKSVAVS